MIAAAAENDALGNDNKLVWHLPDDFRRFKNLTTGHPMIMGRKTFESFPKPLPNREHIIISRNEEYQVSHPQCRVTHSLEDALNLVEDEEKSFIIGGGEIYRLALPYADEIELTRVHGDFEADSFFPRIDASQWKLIREEFHPADEKHRYAFTYRTFKRA